MHHTAPPPVTWCDALRAPPRSMIRAVSDSVIRAIVAIRWLWSKVKEHRTACYETVAGAALIAAAWSVAAVWAWVAVFVCAMAKALEHGIRDAKDDGR